MQSLQEWNNLRKINLSGHALTIFSFHPLKKFKNLRKIDLSNNSIRQEQLYHLAELPHREVLDLHENPLKKVNVCSLNKKTSLKHVFIDQSVELVFPTAEGWMDPLKNTGIRGDWNTF